MHYGSITCHDIQKNIMERSFNLTNPLERKLFLDAVGHKDKCPEVYKNLAQWALKLLLSNHLIPL